jgi:hypothetical protein
LIIIDPSTVTHYYTLNRLIFVDYLAVLLMAIILKLVVCFGGALIKLFKRDLILFEFVVFQRIRLNRKVI